MRSLISLFVAVAVGFSVAACQRGIKIAQILKDPTIEVPELSRSEEEE